MQVCCRCPCAESLTKGVLKLKVTRSPFITVTLAIASAIAITLAACGGDGAAPVPPQMQPTSAPAIPRPADTPIPAATAMPAQEAATALPASTAIPAATRRAAPAVTPTPRPAPYPAAPGIVDVTNRGWPREVETSEGRVSIAAPPQRIHTLSLGHDEIIAALVGTDRFSGIGSFTANATYSNIAGQVEGLRKVKRDAEEALSLEPDLVVASKYSKADLVELIKESGVPVVRAALENSAAGNIPNILLMGYILGAEERALELAAEIEERLAFVSQRTPPPGDAARPAVLSIARFSDTISAAGDGSTEGGIIEAAGGVNAAARDGISGHQTVSVESIAAMNPDVILITQPEPGATTLMMELMQEPALVNVPAIAGARVVSSDPKLYTTLSHWNVRGIEETALLLYPGMFYDARFKDFKPFRGD